MYENLNDTDKYLEYALILDTWKQLKEDQNRVNVSGASIYLFFVQLNEPYSAMLRAIFKSSFS